jgi:hypothetical protein
MPFDKTKAVKFADDNALPVFGKGHCAKYVREALEAGGLNTSGHPVYAKNWGPTLIKIGFTKLSAVAYTPATGDVVVFQPIDSDGAGHIQIYDGSSWVSDFIQPDFYPSHAFQAHKASYEIYRYQ